MSMDPNFKAMLDAQAAAAPAQSPPIDALPPAMLRAGYQMQRKAQNTTVPQDVVVRDLEVAGADGQIPARHGTCRGRRRWQQRARRSSSI